MTVKVDFSKPIGPIKPLHGVGQPPFYGGSDFKMFRYLTEAGIPFSRLHDVGGPYGGGRFVDIPNLFRNFDADPTDPASYDFAFTDGLITALIQAGVEPFFRLGVTIENDMHIKAYRIHPPKDYAKWAVICEMVIRHYTEGWADGFHYDIRYWEIWNEPDNLPDGAKNQMWTGTQQQFFELYTVAAKHLKGCFPQLKIGGYASCGFYALVMEQPLPHFNYYMTFFRDFLAHVKAKNAPLDFFSWHSYEGIEATRVFARHARRMLDEAGYTYVETSCNEWNPEVGPNPAVRGTARHAAVITGMMLALQNEPVDTAMFYDARWGVSIYGSMFNPLTAQPFPAYYGFAAFNELYRRGTQVRLTCDDAGVYALAAAHGSDGAVVIANTNDTALPLMLKMNGEPAGCRMLDGEHMLTECILPEVIPANTVLVITAEV